MNDSVQDSEDAAEVTGGILFTAAEGAVSAICGVVEEGDPEDEPSE
jgi:hypothetical protein